jgi:hypothetical protein
VVCDEDIEAGVQREYRKAGASCPLQRAQTGTGHHAALNQLMAEIH